MIPWTFQKLNSFLNIYICRCIPSDELLSIKFIYISNSPMNDNFTVMTSSFWLYCCRYMTLSVQTSHYICKCIRSVNIKIEVLSFNLTHRSLKMFMSIKVFRSKNSSFHEGKKKKIMTKKVLTFEPLMVVSVVWHWVILSNLICNVHKESKGKEKH